MRKIVALAISLVIFLITLPSCDFDHTNETENASKTESLQNEYHEVYGTYCRTNDNHPDSFTITLYPDGTYQYYETMISSHMGNGKYTVDGNVITLIDDEIPTYGGSATYYFKFEYLDGKLIYLAEGSNNFIYVHLPNGAEFERLTQSEN